MKIGFDNNKYLKMQSEHIRERINQFGDKLYLEFGGKLFDDYHASRVLPGFAPDSKLRMLLQLADQAEIVIVISAADIEKNKVRSDLGITYDVDVLRLIQSFTDKGTLCWKRCNHPLFRAEHCGCLQTQARIHGHQGLPPLHHRRLSGQCSADRQR